MKMVKNGGIMKAFYPIRSDKSKTVLSESFQFHNGMNLPHSVVRHVLSTVALIFRSMAYIPHRFPDNCNDRRFTEDQFLCRASVKRKPSRPGRAYNDAIRAH